MLDFFEGNILRSIARFTYQRDVIFKLFKLLIHRLLFCSLLLSSDIFAAVLTVTTNADAGAGSLRTQVGAAASGDIINFNIGANATITLTSANLTVGNSMTWDDGLVFNASNLTVAGAVSIVLAPATALTINAPNTFSSPNSFSITAPISGSGSVVVTGGPTGTVNLTPASGTNSYTGGTTVSSGTLRGSLAGIQGNILITQRFV